MILRRVIEHLKTQNWTAVTLEFFIVVVGVFIGIQAANWNEDRAFTNREREYLAQLKDEVAQNRRVTEYQVAYVKAVVDAGRRALNFLESDPGGREFESLRARTPDRFVSSRSGQISPLSIDA